MKKKVFLIPIGTGALVNNLYNKTEIVNSFDYAKAVSDINKEFGKGKDEATIKVRMGGIR